MRGDLQRFDAAERRFTGLFFPVALGFGARLALVVFDGPLAQFFTDNGYLIGLLLAVGPLIMTFTNPVFGRLSDRTRTRFGRRIPYAVVAVPLSAAMLFAIPSAPTYGVLLALFALRALFVSIGSGPLMSLVPDLIAPARRGRAMSLFMLAGGIGAIAIQAAGKLFWERNFALVFYATGLLSLLCSVPPLFFIREPRVPAAAAEAERTPEGISPGAMVRALANSGPIALFLASAALRYLGGGMLIRYLTLFAVTDLALSVGDAALAVAVGGLLRLVLALPAGRLADTYDRKTLLLLATLAGALVHLLTGWLVRDLWHLYLAIGAGAIAR